MYEWHFQSQNIRDSGIGTTDYWLANLIFLLSCIQPLL